MLVLVAQVEALQTQRLVLGQAVAVLVPEAVVVRQVFVAEVAKWPV